MIGILFGGYQIYQSRANQKYWKQYEDSLFNSESEGEKVRNRLQGSDVGPEDDMLENPSIYRDWPMVQKGYQSLRMMNDNDNFDAESFSGEWHHFAPCETAGCDGDIEYRDVYYCSSCGQDDTEILIGDTCPECEEVATDTATYAIFYCSDCGEDYTDEYNAEVQTTANKVRTISGKPLQLRKLKKDRDLKPEDAIERLEISAEDQVHQMTNQTQKARRKILKMLGQKHLYMHGNLEDWEDEFEPVVSLGNEPITYRTLVEMLNEAFSRGWGEGLQDAYWSVGKHKTNRMSFNAEGEYRKCTICEEPAHPLYRGKGSLEGARRICYSCNKKAMEDKPSFNNTMLFDADEFNAYVYRGKPMEDLTYSQKAVATKKMIDAADLEATMLQLENAIRLGIISEDELMKELQNKFGSK